MTKEDDSTITAEETIVCFGHQNILAEHKSTFEITKDEHLTKAGTCIIGIMADKGAGGLSENFKKILSNDRTILKTELIAGNFSICITSNGSSEMTLSHETDMVWRKSRYVCSRTVGIYSDFSAASLPDEMIRLLQNGEKMTVKMKATLNPKAPSPSAPPLQEFFHNCEGC
ncbi:MAG: DUF371 domain-containing protein [Methanomicrobium sp.]|nr:DUF371 domain-containing protein [Methanomicrobium sp.]